MFLMMRILKQWSKVWLSWLLQCWTGLYCGLWIYAQKGIYDTLVEKLDIWWQR
ncbi:hypothetical protein ACLB1M_12460 [Escherichia coli]